MALKGCFESCPFELNFRDDSFFTKRQRIPIDIRKIRTTSTAAADESNMTFLSFGNFFHFRLPKIEMENLFEQLSFVVIRRVVAGVVMNKFKCTQCHYGTLAGRTK